MHHICACMHVGGCHNYLKRLWPDIYDAVVGLFLLTILTSGHTSDYHFLLLMHWTVTINNP